MSSANVKQLCESTQTQLKQVIAKLEQFLNHYSLPQLCVDGDREMSDYYKGYLSDLRHLLVFSQVASEKLGVSLRRPDFNQDYAEKVLYETYHSCVNLFFYPANESYSEDGRYAYTGQDAIRFRKPPAAEIRTVTLECSKLFEQLRDDLAYYESSYLTQKNMQTQKS